MRCAPDDKMMPDVFSHDTSAHLCDISVEHRGIVGKATAVSTIFDYTVVLNKT
jgi:hypothetical protein